MKEGSVAGHRSQSTMDGRAQKYGQKIPGVSDKIVSGQEKIQGSAECEVPVLP